MSNFSLRYSSRYVDEDIKLTKVDINGYLVLEYYKIPDMHTNSVPSRLCVAGVTISAIKYGINTLCICR